MSDLAFEPVIGLEVHAQLLTRTKMFCGCSTEYGAPPNTQVCEVCLGLPGALPVPNAKAIELAIRAALSLGCTVHKVSRFARKNYFYPDLSKGYQISQFDQPLNEGGYLDIETSAGKKRVGLTRIHVEEDAAKNLHGIGTGTDTLVDFNRAGTPLIEIVGEPDLRSSEEAEAYLKALRDVLMFAGVNDGNLEEGSFRCDANVSIRPVGQEKFGTRVELKNINSFRFVRKAIDFEVARQETLITGGGKVFMETRTWSDAQGKTLSMRSKEEAHDYRYFTDPDLPVLELSDAQIEDVRSALPESLPNRRARWQREWSLTDYDSRVLTGHPAIAAYFEEVVAQTAKVTKKSAAELGKKAANFVLTEVLRVVTTNGLRGTFPVPEDRVAGLLGLIEDGTINGKIAKDVFADMVKTGKSAKQVVDAKGLAQVVDSSAIELEIRKVVDANPKEVDKWKAGKATVKGFFVGQIMKATRGTANPALVNELLDKVLAEKSAS
jgi:aspartyl-tRNA(Asn)/glutamyl-tRNA(Gln) amidotransferase subunit B